MDRSMRTGGDETAKRFFARGADTESARARGEWLRALTMEERGELALRLLAFAETMRQSTGPRPRRPLDRSLAGIMAAARKK